jgi:hypothetical protein
MTRSTLSVACMVCGRQGATRRSTAAWAYQVNDAGVGEWAKYKPHIPVFLCRVHRQKYDVIDTWVERGDAPDTSLLARIEDGDERAIVWVPLRERWQPRWETSMEVSQ